MFISSLCSKSLIQTLTFFPSLLDPCGFFFISLSVYTLSVQFISLHLFPYVFAILSEFSKHPYHQSLELCI